jgi:TonB family protein
MPPIEPVPDVTAIPPPADVSETVVMPEATAMPEPIEAAGEEAGAMVDVDSLRTMESNYWLHVRSEMIQHLRWPAGLPRSALVMVELTIDDEGGLVGVSTHPEAGDERYARGVERAVRRAAPFPPPGPVCRTARLPVRFSNHNPTEK